MEKYQKGRIRASSLFDVGLRGDSTVYSDLVSRSADASSMMSEGSYTESIVTTRTALGTLFTYKSTPLGALRDLTTMVGTSEATVQTEGNYTSHGGNTDGDNALQTSKTATSDTGRGAESQEAGSKRRTRGTDIDWTSTWIGKEKDKEDGKPPGHPVLFPNRKEVWGVADNEADSRGINANAAKTMAASTNDQTAGRNQFGNFKRGARCDYDSEDSTIFGRKCTTKSETNGEDD